MTELQTVWSWQPALYLFLGGMGGGAFLVAALLHFSDRVRNRLVACASMWAATFCLGIGLLLLLSELIHPARGLLLWQSFSHFTSWMTYGAWIVFAAVIVFGISAVLGTERAATIVRAKDAEDRTAPLCPRLRDALAVIGAILGVCVAAYTGMLLMSAPGIPLWNTPLLPCLFTVSAIDTGIALVEVISLAVARKHELSEKEHRLINLGVVALVILELGVLAALLGTSLAGAGSLSGSTAAVAAESATLLTTGTLAPFFWILVVACGLVCPLAVAAFGLARKGEVKPSTMAIGAGGALLGGCALRFLVLFAGLHADPIAQTVAGLFM